MASNSSLPRPVRMTEEDLLTAWEVISPHGDDVLTKSQLLDSLRLFFPHITARDVKQLVGPGNLSLDKLRELLFHTQTPDSAFTDPNWEAFKIIDPHGTGYVEMNVLKRLLMQLPGVDMIDDDDVEFLHKLVDVDGDGRISFRDWAQVGSWAPDVELPSEALRKLMLEKLAKEGVERM
uniref:EF-hand domain-containing protein n=1 Tax=Chlamydomonas euryale TaxID=1486919 RepID=A0A7R9VYC1_9CHLO|mmetsp:Transcript_7520/g.22778  ORF Transcript_7520/g.22778 Transcript_7520/m.22778 type:complete len:178 (+) Transcript_7520:239-772(+)